MKSPQGLRSIVLVVDDNPPTLGVLNEALEAAGYTVLVALSGDAALRLAEQVTPDIILMDAVMPGRDGFETCRLMKQVPLLRSVPVVFMTGLSDTENVIRGLEAGGVDYVTKPLAPDEVVARLGVHLANARLTRSAQQALDTAGRFLLAVNPTGDVLWATPQAVQILLASGFDDKALPALVLPWLHARAADRETGLAPTLELAVPTGKERRVVVSFVGSIGAEELLLRLSIANQRVEDALLREKLLLTTREAEVLLWLSRGKSNRDIADILDLSPRTVSKHLEQLFEKLGVENRAAATALAVRTLQAQ